jgi:Tfp pilus assembly protein PilN
MLMTFVVISVLIAAVAFWIMMGNLIELVIQDEKLKAENNKQDRHNASVAKLAKEQKTLLEEHKIKQAAKSAKSHKMVN